MKTFDEIHEEAMSCAENGERLRKNNNGEQAQAAYAQGLALELEAIERFASDDPLTHTVLLRSAAGLAIGAKDFVKARELIERGLRENPHPDIQPELEQLQAQLPPEPKTTTSSDERRPSDQPQRENLQQVLENLPADVQQKWLEQISAREPMLFAKKFQPKNISNMPRDVRKPLWGSKQKDAA